MSSPPTTGKESAATVAILVTGLYDDAATVEAALESNQESSQASTHCTKINLHPENMTDDDWDDAVNLVLSVSKVITV